MQLLVTHIFALQHTRSIRRTQTTHSAHDTNIRTYTARTRTQTFAYTYRTHHVATHTYARRTHASNCDHSSYTSLHTHITHIADITHQLNTPHTRRQISITASAQLQHAHIYAFQQHYISTFQHARSIYSQHHTRVTHTQRHTSSSSAHTSRHTTRAH